MKKLANLCAIVAIIGLMYFGMAHARITTATATDIWCVGPSGLEVCVDGSGNVIQTTTNTSSLGTSTLRWSNIYTTLLNVSSTITASAGVNVTGTLAGTTITASSKLTGPFPTAQRLNTGNMADSHGTSDIIDISASCGGVKRIYSNHTAGWMISTDSNNVFTAPSSTYQGCVFDLINVGSQSIKLIANASFGTLGNTDIVLTSSGTMRVAGDGSCWYQVGTSIAAQ